MLICVLFIFYLFRLDIKKKADGVSMAIWIPLAWMFLAGSRYVSHWLNYSAPTISSIDLYMEGSPIDRAVFLFLIAASVVVLVRRRLSWGQIIRNNTWVWLFFLFGLISIIWSDYPFISFKRWIKTLGNVSMVLVILTEERPCEAIGVIMRRLAFLLLPLSVLFIKYYPDLGRAYHMGQPMFTGIADQKNALGQACLLSGIYFCWILLFNRREGIQPEQRLHYTIYLIFIFLSAWLLYKANSATSTMCMFLAICLFVVGRMPAIVREPKKLLTIGISCIVLFGFLELYFGFTGSVISMLGRNQDLTSRVPVWEELLAMNKNPLIGAGFEIFWSGERMTQIWEKRGTIIQAHNGYIDIYLNLGIVGLCLLVNSIISGLIKTIKHLNFEYTYGMLKVSFIIVVVFYNLTEATFKPLSNMFIFLLLGILEVPGSKNDQEQQ